MQNHPGHTKANKPTCWRHPADGTSTEQGRKGKSFSQNDWKRCGLKPAAAAYQRELRVLQPAGQSRRLAHGLEQRGPQRTVIISADSPDGGEFLRYFFIALGESIREFKMVVTDFRESFVFGEKMCPDSQKNGNKIDWVHSVRILNPSLWIKRNYK